MNTETTTVKQTIKQLIEAGTTFDIATLDLIYHKDLKVIMIAQDGEKTLSDKEAFKSLFQQKLKNGDIPLNTWAKFHHIETHKHKALVIVSRKVNLIGIEQKLMLSIDLVYEENRWQVTREVILVN